MSPTSLQEYEAAIVALVPEAESLVGPFRTQYDPSAAAGMPAHLTINYPFKPRLTQEELSSLFLGFRPFEFSLSEVKSWPDVIYFSPEPSTPFKVLIEHVAQRFPESPPYGWQIADVIPHLTVAHDDDPGVLDQVAADLAMASTGKLPITVQLEELWLMIHQAGRWEKRERLRLVGNKIVDNICLINLSNEVW